MNPSPPPLFVVPGMSVGCLPYDALSSGSLECFFSSACLNSTVQWISNLPVFAWPNPLDSSKLAKFLTNSTIASIMDEQMIDQWNNTVDFAAYYSACAPTQCTYTFVHRGNILYAVTLLISLAGSLNIALRIVAPLIIQGSRYLLQIFIKKKKHSNISHGNVKQSMSLALFHTFC